VGHNPNLAEPIAVEEKYLAFLLDRLVHDLSNSIGGIFSLSDHHLRTGLTDVQSLEESLKLIYRSCEESRRILLLVGQLLQSEPSSAELTRVSALLAEVDDTLRLLLPRSVELICKASTEDGAVRVERNRLMRHFAELFSLTVPRTAREPAKILLATTIEPDLATILYRSELPVQPDLLPTVHSLFLDLLDENEIFVSQEAGVLEVHLHFPLVQI
jgi:hypothetical protein